MADEALVDQSEVVQSQSQDGGKRERSAIQFPYLPLEEAITIAKGVHAVGGQSCQVDQLAAHLNQRPDAGSFRLKLGTAKMFGLTTHALGTVTLTQLGGRICDSRQEEAAKADSFLAIPLYLKVYEQFKGATLPPIAGLEAAMVTMGVAPKQKSTARQVFQRSATVAGFFWSGENRLVYPRIKGGVPGGNGGQETPAGTGDGSTDRPPTRTANGGGGEQHPFIQGLIKTLPASEGSWPIEKRAQWLQAAVSVFNLIYTDDNATSRIEVKLEKNL